MNIALIGYRGTGKTSVGKALAERLGKRFFDADAYLEDKVGRTISDMVGKEGWPFFRTREKEAIVELSGYDDAVIATGGGAVMDESNVSALARNSRFILLKADIRTTVSRIDGDRMSERQRPVLAGGGLVEETRKVLAQRMPTYERVADYTVDTTGLSIEEVVKAIVDYLGRSAR